jgi:hypothetical protein
MPLYPPNHIWHITQRSPKREFFFRFARDRQTWIIKDLSWPDPEPHLIEPSTLSIALFLPRIGGIAVTITLPVSRLIFGCKFNFFQPFSAFVKVAVWYQGPYPAFCSPCQQKKVVKFKERLYQIGLKGVPLR